MTFALTCSIPLPERFRPDDVLAFHRRDAQEVAERVVGESLRKGLVWNEQPACLDIEFHDGKALARLSIDGLCPANIESAFGHLVRRMLGLTQDIEAFEECHRGHPQLGPTLARQAGLRVPLSSTPFEALSWAITGQQISVPAAISVRRNFILAAGVRHSGGLFCYPEAGHVATLTDDVLRQAGFSGSKARTLLELSRLIANGRLSMNAPAHADDAEHLREQLRIVKGIGPWTINYALLRGYGWLDGSLHGDAAVRRGLQKLTESNELVTESRAEDWLREFSPWRALVAAHLWANQSSAAIG